MESLYQRIVDILGKQGVRASQITPQAHFLLDLGFDSLDQTEFLMELESEFKIVIPHEDMQEIATVGQAVSYLEAKLKAAEEKLAKY